MGLAIVLHREASEEPAGDTDQLGTLGLPRTVQLQRMIPERNPLVLHLRRCFLCSGEDGGELAELKGLLILFVLSLVLHPRRCFLVAARTVVSSRSLRAC